MNTSNLKRERIHNALIWAAQIVLAFLFVAAGSMKATKPINELTSIIAWTGDVPIALVRFIGICEILAAIGVVLPSLFRIKPLLTPLAGLCLFSVMVMAFVFHLVRGEYDGLMINSVLGILAGIVAWGRYQKAPIQNKNTAAVVLY